MSCLASSVGGSAHVEKMRMIERLYNLIASSNSIVNSYYSVDKRRNTQKKYKSVAFKKSNQKQTEDFWSSLRHHF